MALWSIKENDIHYCRKAGYKRLKKDPLRNLIRHESFFISDGGGQNGIRIDFVERRQAAQAMMSRSRNAN